MQQIGWGATVGAFAALLAALAYPLIGANGLALLCVVGIGALVGTVVSGGIVWYNRRK